MARGPIGFRSGERVTIRNTRESHAAPYALHRMAIRCTPVLPPPLPTLTRVPITDPVCKALPFLPSASPPRRDCGRARVASIVDLLNRTC